MTGIKLPTTRRLGLYAVAALLWASGAIWLVAHYYLVAPGDFGPVTSPAEPWALTIHGGAAMAALWFAGLLWGVHVVSGWRGRRGRWSGGLLVGLLGLLAVTGYLLYYVSNDDLRGWTSIVHWVVGLAALPAFLWHRFARKALRRSG